MKEDKIAEKAVTIEQLYELLPHMQAGRIMRADIQMLIENAASRELQQMRNECVERAHALIIEIKPPEHVQVKILQEENTIGLNHYIERATYERVRILTSLYSITGEGKFLNLAHISLDVSKPHLHPYEEAMIRLRIAEVTESITDYENIVALAFRGYDGFAKRVTVLCDLALISGQSRYFDMAKDEKGKLTNPSHIARADSAIEYLEHRKSCSVPSKVVLARDDVLFPKFTSYLLQNSEAGDGVDVEKTINLICNKHRLDDVYAIYLQENDIVSRKIRLFRLAIAHAVCGNVHFSRSIMHNHEFDRGDRDRLENIFAKTMSKKRRLDASFTAAVAITDPYLKADAFCVIASEINNRLKK